ncbi:unannotated protein [freshwater metagenome]|uniref:Unannotated protein n=1 Tax=freshwater metagenome TaxID=449393 RepID=A0A6J6IX92_9ZZZZ|nr:hypothetical protein [Actinomycetota bacterium]
MKRIVSLFSALALLFGLTGCTVPTDPYVATVKSVVAKTVFTPTGDMASGCIGMYLLCSQPLYEPSFQASSSTETAAVCRDFVALGKELGSVAYSTYGYSAYKLPQNTAEVTDLCGQALGVKLTGSDGSNFYQGVVLYDDGKADGWGKIYALSRGNSVNPDDFQLVISFSRDLNRVGWIDYGTEKPKALTQKDLDSQG